MIEIEDNLVIMNEIKERIIGDLKELGIDKGDTILVHSSLKSLGEFDNRSQIIVDSILEVLGSDGTLLMPALSYKYVPNEHPVFHWKNTHSCVGGLTEYFRKRKGIKRSVHPTHSVCAFGKNADYMIKDHILDQTPCGAHSPFRKLIELDGQILFLGCGTKPNTSMHAIEELVNPVYLFGKKIDYDIIFNTEDIIKKSYITHDFNGYEQRYDRVLNILNKNDYSKNKVHGADSYLIKATPLWERVYQKLKKYPLYFVDKIEINEKIN